MLCKLAIFDLDGTILDTIADLTDAVNYVLNKAGYPQRTLEEVRSFVGNGIRKTIERSVPAGTPAETIDVLFADFTVHYKAHCADKTCPYEGIEELVRTLREAGMKTAVVSNKADYAVKMLCEEYFPGLFDAAVGDREGVRRKPAPDTVFAVLEELGVGAEDCVYIGDSDVDMHTARNAGMDEILVSWGFRGRAFLEEIGGKCVVDHPKEIAEMLLK